MEKIMMISTRYGKVEIPAINSKPFIIGETNGILNVYIPLMSTTKYTTTE